MHRIVKTGLLTVLVLGSVSAYTGQACADKTILDWGTAARGSSHGVDLATDNQGNTLVTGTFVGSSTFGPGEPNETTLTGAGALDVFVSKYAKDGALEWAARAAGTSGDRSMGIATDGAGNAVVTGLFDGSSTFGLGESNETTLTSAGDSDIFVAKYGADGTLVWAMAVGGLWDDRGGAITTDRAGNIIVTGSFSGSVTFGPGESNETTLTSAGEIDTFVAKYGADGLLAWVRRAGGAYRDQGRDIATDSSENIVVAGEFSQRATFGVGEANETTLRSVNRNSSIFLAKYGPNGSLAWVKQAGDAQADESNGVAIDRYGNSIITGSFYVSATFGAGEPNETTLTSVGDFDPFVAKYGPDGTLLWAVSAGGVWDDLAADITSDGAGNILATGIFHTSATFGRGEANETTLTSEDNDLDTFTDIFVAKYGADGTLMWVMRVGGPEHETAGGIVTDGLGRTFLTGSFQGNLTLGAGEQNETTLTSGGNEVMFLGRYHQETVITIEGEVPTGEEAYFFLPFDVPEGIAEIEVRHDDLSTQNILDWGLDDPNGFRGWSGASTAPAILGINGALPGYVPGPIPSGTWEVVVGKARLAELPARFAVEVVLRSAPTLPAQTERTPYVPTPPLQQGPRWYAGDFHVHSLESGDTAPSIEEVLNVAESRGMDFILLSEHNTTSQLSLYDAAQAESPNVLLLPGAEFTSYSGHANAIGTTEWVNHRIGVRGASIEDAIEDVHAQDGLFSINHPLRTDGDLCIGCSWKLDVDPTAIDGVEIQSGRWRAIDYWENLVAEGSHAAALGGSDAHQAGQVPDELNEPIGSPTTMVYAEELSVDAIIQAVREGLTVVKLGDPSAPMIVSELSGDRSGDTVTALVSTLSATVTGGVGTTLEVYKNGLLFDQAEVTADPFTYAIEVEAPLEGEDRYRHEVSADGDPLTITSYIWLQRADEPPADDPPVQEKEDAGGCSTLPVRRAPAAPLLALAAIAAWAGARRLGLLAHGDHSEN